MRRSIEINVPTENGGSEAALGLDYQHHIFARKCIEMLSNRNIREIVCEFHQDGAQIDYDGRYRLISVKKPKSRWKLEDLTRVKRGKKSILASLFEKIHYKEVIEVSFFSNGRPDTELLRFMSLLATEHNKRDLEWDSLIKPYEKFIYERLQKQGINEDSVRDGIRLLNIDLDFPSQDAMEACNRELLESTITEIWKIHVDLEMKQLSYKRITDRVRDISKKPRQPRSVKTIRRDEVIRMVKSTIGKRPLPESTEETTNMHEKILGKAKLKKNHLYYGLERRFHANFIRFELELDENEWMDYQDQLYERWNSLLGNSPQLEGIKLWRSLRCVCQELGDQWKSRAPSLDRSFAEGLFFFMTAACTVEWRV